MDPAGRLSLVAPQALIVTCPFCKEQHDYDALAMAMALNGLPWLHTALKGCIQCLSRVINKRLSYTIGDPVARHRLKEEIRRHPQIAEITYATDQGMCAVLLSKPDIKSGAPIEIRIYG